MCFRVMCLAELVTLGIGVIVVTWFVVSIVPKYCLSENWFSYRRVEADNIGDWTH